MDEETRRMSRKLLPDARAFQEVLLNITLEAQEELNRTLEIFEIPIEFSGIEVLRVESNDEGLTLTASVSNAKMTFYPNDKKNILPDLTRGLRGVLVAENVPVIELRTIPVDEARSLIIDYIKENHGALTSDIIYDLAIDVDLVIEILRELRKEEEIIPVNTP